MLILLTRPPLAELLRKHGDENSVLGYQAGSAIDSGKQNVIMGSQTMQYGISVNRNTAIGYQAGRNISGHDNIVLGNEAGENITSGAGNVVIGSVNVPSATGNRQLVIAGNDESTTTTWISGDSAGLLTITGGEVIPGKLEGTNFTNSLLIGHSTTGTLDDARNNAGVGIGTLDALTSGDNNTAIGKGAGTAITTGGNNTALGTNSLLTVSTGAQNTAIGRDALKLTTGDYNIGIGYTAGANLTSGAGNM